MHPRTFKLDTMTLVIGDTDGKRVTVTIPAGDTVRLIADQSAGEKMVDGALGRPHGGRVC
jgi:hypothetical protein